MNKEEARSKFGQYTEDSEGNMMWEIDHNKLRGLFLRYSREVEYLEGPSEWPNPEEWIDHFWSWVRDSIGTGYKGILQGKGISPSGKFDRLSKREACSVATKYYESHDEFSDNMDSVWEVVDRTEGLVSEHDSYSEVLEEMPPGDVIETFFNIYDKHDNITVGKRQSANAGAYKFHIKHWVFEVETISSESDRPNAEALVMAWVDWMEQEILNTSAAIVDLKPDEHIGGTPIPEIDDVVGWCRELWEDSGDFRDDVKDKWNKPVSDSDGNMPDAGEVVGIRDNVDIRHGSSSGQKGITDFGN